MTKQQYSPVIWLNGDYVKIKKGNIPIMTHALHYGSSVYEGIRVYNHKPFKLAEHIQRLLHSAEQLHLKALYKHDVLEEAVLGVVARNDLDYAYIRPIAWRGDETPRIDGRICTSHWGIIGWPSFIEQQREKRKQGLSLDINPTWRKAPAGCTPHTAKASGLYTVATIARLDAEDRGFDDTVLLDTHDNVTEASTANIFFIKNNELYTPIADCFLNGITRQTVLVLAAKLGIICHECKIPVSTLGDYQTAFITGTAVEVTPIRELSHGDRLYSYDAHNHLLHKLCESYEQATKQ